MSASASRDREGKVHVSIVNAHATQASKLACTLEGIEASKVSGRILTAEELDSHNTFDDPERVKPAAFDGASLDGDTLTAEIPPRSVVVLRLDK